MSNVCSPLLSLMMPLSSSVMTLHLSLLLLERLVLEERWAAHTARNYISNFMMFPFFLLSRFVKC